MAADANATLEPPPLSPRTPSPHRVVLLNLELPSISSTGISSRFSGTEISLKSTNVDHAMRRVDVAERSYYHELHSESSDSSSSGSEHSFDIEDDDVSSEEGEVQIRVGQDVFVSDGEAQHVPIAARSTLTAFAKFDSRFAQSSQPCGTPYYALDPNGLITVDYWADMAARNYVLATCSHHWRSSGDFFMASGESWTTSMRRQPEVHALTDELQHLCMQEKQIRDTSMLVEYADEIFQHMEQCGLQTMPNPDYMREQDEDLGWNQRASMINWMSRLFDRVNLLPETLWFAVNLIDRFLSLRVISRAKLNLVGIVATFIAIKHQEVGSANVEDLVTIMNNVWSREQILAGERIVYKTLNCNMSYCSPHSWIRHMSKADNYDHRTRSIAYFLMDLSLFDHRFLLLPPCMIAAVAMLLARRMIGGAWDVDCIRYSRFAAEQLQPAAKLLHASLCAEELEYRYIYGKYSQIEYGTASSYARSWALSNPITSSD